ncbi:hypothetical protein FisN_19Hu314 [Fistulifera solaris]|uniref:Uncharacterized protein n=1 Tax=Fistulifera solaris TaxID=1519565 RepID=A0A1Z5K0F1_FISSO|nr:hypothetical protein FisN_19Hu314 [Fistulifera solaris]|eukprot:GAX19727.1 hypothetical protein FisN_19Hu314 [Fistulifera solaris]
MGVMTAPITQLTVDRYLNCWLPLLADIHRSNASCMLIPPPDVSWVSHCHRLAPGPYRKYLLQQFQDDSIEESCPPFLFQIKEDTTNKALETRVEWDLRFPASVNEQKKFLWQVSDRKFKHDTFLQHAIERYQKFLLLSKSFHRERGSDCMIVPTYDIDLMWHTHILHSIAKYEADCIRIRGSFLNHDDSLNDRSSGSNLEMAFQQTSEAWQQSYKEPYINSSDVALYRGEPPADYYSIVDATCCAKNMNLMSGETESKLFVSLTERKRESNETSTSISISNEAMSEEPVPVVYELTPSTPLEEFMNIRWVKPDNNLVPGTTEKAFVRVSKIGEYLKKDGYVFGETSNGSGYYSLCTQEAYRILKEKLQRKESDIEARLSFHYMQTCQCFRTPTEAALARTASWEKELQTVRKAKQFVLIQEKASGPYQNLCYVKQPSTRIVTSRPFPLDCVLRVMSERETINGLTLGDVCDAAGCGGSVKVSIDCSGTIGDCGGCGCCGF